MSAHLNGIRRFAGRLLEASVILLLAASNVGAQARGPTVSPSHPIAENYYAAGDRIEVTVPIEGDVVVAGRNVEIADTVSGDVLAAGWHVSFTGRTPDDVRVAGADVKLDGVITGDLTAAGGALITGPRTHVAGRTWLTGQTVRVEGRFERELRIAAQTVQLAGEMAQPVTVIAEKLEVLPSARIQGPLNYKSPTEASIAPAASIDGPIAYEKITQNEAKSARSWRGISSLLFLVHLVIGGLLLSIISPRLPAECLTTMRNAPAQSALLGIALVVTTPVAVLLLLVSVIGIPVGISLGALYLIGLILGVVTTAFFVGDWEAHVIRGGPTANWRQRMVWLIVGAGTLAVLRSVPLLGTLVVFTSVLFGLGAVSLSMYRTYASLPPHASAS